MKNKANNSGLDGQLLKKNEELQKKIAQLQIELEATKIMHQSLKEGQDFLQEVLLSQGETFVIVIDENQMINLVWCSERLEIKYGFVFQTLMGHSFKEFFSNYIKGGYSDQIVEVFNNSKTLREEVEAIMPSGAFWWDVTFFPIMGDNNEIRSVVVTSRDISERKKYEKKLRESEEKYQNLFNKAHVGIFSSRVSDGKSMECNEYFANMVGYNTREECLEEYIGSEYYVNPNDREKILENVKETGYLENYEVEVVKRDGTPYWTNFSVNLDLKRQRLEGIVIDITERKKMEEKIKESENTLRIFINSATDHILLFDSELNIIEINELALNALNLKRSDAIGMSILDISPDLKESGRYSKYMHVIKTGEPLFIEKLVVHPKYGNLSQEVKIFKVGNGLGIISRDIADR